MLRATECWSKQFTGSMTDWLSTKVTVTHEPPYCSPQDTMGRASTLSQARDSVQEGSLEEDQVIC